MYFPKDALKIGMMMATVCCGAAAFADSPIQYIKPIDGPKVVGPYSPGVVADLSQGKLVFVAGQLPIIPETGERVSSSVKDATRQVLENVERILKASGSGLEYVLRCDVFLKDMKDFAEMNEEYAKHFPVGMFPARQTTQSDIPVLVEISCIAFVPN
jgi:2-iminobutanoate/2-iminopropanoate deaminase